MFLEDNWQNKLYTGDNLYILNGMNSESVDLIYLDPPFNSKRTYSAPIGSKAAGTSFKDMWTWKDVDEYYLERLTDKHPGLVHFIESIEELHSKAMMAYVTYMTQRILECHRILKNTGSLYLHCDPTASHYLKLALDEIFGRNNFLNEIIWCYKSGGASTKYFSRKHDVILFYSKSTQWNFNFIKEKSYGATGGGQGGKVQYFKDENGTYSMAGIKDWWLISMLSTTHSERTGYPTQKPLALMNRIIEASSQKGDIVLDPFCGCATTCVAAENLGRKWIGIDIEKQAVSLVMERLKNAEGHLFSKFINLTESKRTDIVEEIITINTKEKLFKQQNGICNGCMLEFNIQNFEVDHIIPKAKGGGDYYENYQLLCGSCNRIKGDRPMDYLRMKIETREKLLKNRIRFGE